MKEYPLFLRKAILGVVGVLLATCLTVATVHYQHSSKLFCQGALSAGFPVAFICDASGESPLSSVGQIDWADLDSVNLAGTLVDILFYMALMWIVWLAVLRLLRFVSQRRLSLGE